MRAKGVSRKQVLARLKQIQAKDLKYKDGKILCSMCTTPHSTARMSQRLFSESNLGDPGLFPGSVQLEKEVVSSLSKLLHGKNSVGFIVSGGTEANMLAILAARNASTAKEPEVILPESAHFSFNKICSLLKVKPVYARLDKSFRAEPSSVTQLIGKNTIAIVASAGSAELGAIDPIENLSKIALDYGVYLHVDAALGGLVLPFLKDLGYSTPDFDFQCEGVQSITVDPHKMGMSTIPAGGILFRDNSYLECIKTETPYLTEDSQYTFVGTRSGSSVAAAWAVFASLGREGFIKTVKHCMTLTKQLSSGLEALGFKVLIRPTMNIVTFRTANTKELTEKLQGRGWFVSYVPRLDCVRVVLMPHSTKQHITAFLQVLKELSMS
jgi:tyrosine decarboxylase / aspartate 1-decarboxylase